MFLFINLHSILMKFIETIKSLHPGQPEFHQAIEERYSSLETFLHNHPEYTQDNLLSRIIEPERVIIFRIPWMDDQWSIQVNRWYRVQFNSAIWPYKGGLRFHPSVNLSILKFLWFEQIFKNALTWLPMGWGKWWSDFDPKWKSDKEVMRFCQAFISELYRHIWADTDIPAGDIGVGAREIGYMVGMYKKLKNQRDGTFTGKWLSYGGSLIRPEATGYGLVYFVNEMLTHQNDTLQGKIISVSWSGNVAQYAIEKSIQLWATVISVSDSDGSIHIPSWFTLDLLDSLKNRKNTVRGRLSEFAQHHNLIYLSGQSPWSLKTDIALPCATQNELNLKAAEELVKNGVKIIAEWANMPTTLDATNYFINNNVLFAPGKASNAGGVATSGLEMSQNNGRISRTREEVDIQLQQIMKSIHKTCIVYWDNGTTINYVQWANVGGFIKVADAMIAQGIV